MSTAVFQRHLLEPVQVSVEVFALEEPVVLFVGTRDQVELLSQSLQGWAGEEEVSFQRAVFAEVYAAF